MEDVKIMENMREALKRTKKRSKKLKHHQTAGKSSRDGEDTIGEELGNKLMRNWMFSSPPAVEKNVKNDGNVESKKIEDSNAVKVNAFERLMSRKAEPLSPISPELNGVKKKQRKSAKKPKFSKSTVDDEENSTATFDESSNSIKKFLNGSSSSSAAIAAVENVKEIEEEVNKTTRKRNRMSEAIEVDESQVLVLDSCSSTKLITSRKRTKLERVELDSNENNVDESLTYQSGRPRRSCAGKVNYEFLMLSPEKDETKSSRSVVKTSPEIIQLVDDVNDDEDDELKLLKRKKKKLAPVFVKKVPKPSIDPAVKEARRSFLLSGLPEDLRQSVDKQRQYEDEILSNELVAFPTISHVMQCEVSLGVVAVDDWKKSRVKLKPIEDDDEVNVDYSRTILYRGQLTRSNLHAETNALDGVDDDDVGIYELEISKQKEIVKHFKAEYGAFPTNRCFKLLHRKLKKNALLNDENFLFVDILKPVNYEEFFINIKPVKELSNFLQTWNEKSDSFDELTDESCSRQSSRVSNNFVVLTGDSGSGKTSSVYALANDLNYRVIEINAGTRRSGKKMLQDLQEATQSHRVQMQDETDSQNSDNSDQKSLILIEDAELVFESDDGFVSSIQQLINISKRPVILTTNNANCQHLQKFINHNEIAFNVENDDENNSNNIGKYLSLLCLAANYRIDSNEIQHLFNANGRDMRKTINEIEFFTRSRCAMMKLNDDLLGFYAARKDGGDARRPAGMGTTVTATATATKKCKQLTDMSSMHFELSMMSSLSAILSSRWNEENRENDLIHSMRSYLVDRCNLMETQQRQQQRDSSDDGEGMQKIIVNSTIASLLITKSSTNRTLNIDYSPLMREICRSERSRVENGRRTSSNRGHYLRFLIVNNSFNNDYFNEQAEMFQQ